MKTEGHTETQLIAIQKHRDQWRGYAYGMRDKPMDFLDGNMVDRPVTIQETQAIKIAALQQANEQMESALNRIADWCKAYPVECFPEPDWEDVKRLLGAELLTQVSAANMRHVVNGIAKIVADALAEAEGETGI